MTETTKIENCSAVILSGGKNTRMGGQNKAFLPLGKGRFLDRIVDTLSPLFDDIIIATRQPDLYHEWHLPTAVDVFDIRSPLAGIHAGLIQAKNDFAFITSCDIPLLKRETVQVLTRAIEPGISVVVPASGTYLQPLCAIYAKRCSSIIEELLDKNEVKVDRLFDRLRVRHIDYSQFEAVDPNLDSFFNINTPADLAVVREGLG